MTCDAINLDLFFFQQNVVTNLQHTDGTIEVSTHEVGKVEFIASRTYEHGASFLQTCDRLARNIVVCHQSTTVSITFKCLVEEFAVELIHINLDTKQLLIFLKEIYPGVNVACTVVAVNHSNE